SQRGCKRFESILVMEENKMEEYTRTPLKVEAVKWNPDDPQPVIDWLTAGNAPWAMNGTETRVLLMAPTAPDGKPNAHVAMRVEPGDWVIKGVNGDFYKLDELTFSQTYEKT